MAVVGQQLTAPEAGWRRYDDNYPFIIYEANKWANYTGSSLDYNKRSTGAKKDLTANMVFYFLGRKLTLITYSAASYSKDIQVKIDGKDEGLLMCFSKTQAQNVSFTKQNLDFGIHKVEVIITRTAPNADTYNVRMDAIDIDDTGRILHEDEVIDIQALKVGKRIRCHYQATSNQVGVFSGLGEETSGFISVSSSATPNGDFYFIMVEDWNGKKRLIADRNIQHSISWDTLNSSAIASGIGLPLRFPEVPYNIEVPYINMTGSFSTNPSTLMSGNTSADWKNQIVLSSPINKDIIYTFTESKVITSYDLYGWLYGWGTQQVNPPISWDFEGFEEDPGVWKIIQSELVPQSSWGSMPGVIKKSFTLKNTKAYKKYRIKITSYVGSVGVTGIRMNDDINKKHNFDVRLLTGGISAADKDNEWDKYIVNSTLNGMIGAGDNNVWNHSSQWSWTSTTSTRSNYRTIRRSNEWNGGSPGSEYLGNNVALRPVLEIESLKSIQKKSLIYHDGKYKRFVGNNGNIKYSSDTVIPKMTSNTTPLGRAFSSSSYSSSYDPWKAFNQLDDNEGFASGISSNGVGYLGYEFEENVLIGKYLLRSVGSSSYLKNMPKTWTFEGSSNGLDWVILDTQINQTWNKVLSDKEYIIKEPSLYKMYRINVTEANASVNYFDVNEFKIYSIEEWEAISTTTPTVEQFLEHGMDLIPTTKLPLLGDVRNLNIITWVGDEKHVPIVKLTAIPHTQIVLPTKDINIRSIENIDYIKLTINELKHGRIRVITSFDGGLRWHTHNGMKWIEVSPIVEEVILHGLSAATLSAVTSTQWAELRGNSNTMRFAYALSIEDTTDVAEIDALTTQMDMKGTWKKAVHDKDYDYEYPNNDELLVTIYADGDYKINY